jgi:ribosomal protein S18 acetylase RimI-like enzyme
VIRAARPSDERALRKLDLSTWSTIASPAPPPPPDQPFELDGVLVAELADGIAGYVKIGQALPIAASRHVLEIKGLSVSPEHRRQGVGRALVHAAVGAARSAGARRLTLRVLSHNTDARALYTASGFEIEGVLRGYFRLDGRYVDDVLMALDLSEGR